MGVSFPLSPDGGPAEQREAVEGWGRRKGDTIAYGQGVVCQGGSHESLEVRYNGLG